MGGTGKTPTTIELVRRLNDMGKNPCVISRGYGGNTAGPVMVDIRKHTADDMGDEPILMAAFAPVCVARDRVLGAKLALQNGADVLVLDDALQNPSLFHDLTITVVDGAVGFGNGRVFPAGPLREPTETGLSRSDLVISIGGMVAIDGPDAVSATLDPLQTGMDWQGLRALAFAGIGRPEKFYKTLRDLGADVVQTRSFGDHQKIPEPLLKRLLTEAQAMNAQLVTTEKDAARLPKAWQQQVITLPVRLNIKQDAKLCALLQGLF
ncbi:tetraacyldisaccharide 4'-kinase [Amylibacter marinus]|uniref:Tetraacyldisaccharide 4'-kinase n=2 Tax=Amylibacter marinus TaxID=1475483 RepID=A0ABQ5VW43_9RHOB|nr:tetraacyldisaccharide 4'-kinase [Amylibacter marinus]